LLDQWKGVYYYTSSQKGCICQILEKKWECNETVHELFIDFKKAYDSIRREVLYSILIEFGLPMKLARLIKMCLNETYSKVHISKHLSDSFHIQNSLNQGDAPSPLLFNSALEYAIKKIQVNQESILLYYHLFISTGFATCFDHSG
jgi:hypothetical protein